jgi:hypothetical protein
LRAATPSGDPKRDAIMKRLHAKGLKFAGANTMVGLTS